MDTPVAPTASVSAVDRGLRRAALVAAIAALGYLVFVAATDGDAFLVQVGRLGWAQWISLLGLSLANYGLRFLRWHHYLALLGSPVPLARNLAIYIAGFAFTLTPGKAGEAVRSLYLRDVGTPWSRGLSALAVERVLDVFAVVILALLALQALGDYVNAVILMTILAALLLLGVTRPAVLDRLGSWSSGHARPMLQGMVALLEDARTLLVPGQLLLGLSLGVVAWGAEAWGFYLLLQWLGVSITVELAISVYASSMLVGALSFLPGGIGGAEAAMMALLLSLGVALDVAVPATMICRAVTLWFAVALGLVGVLFAGRRIRAPEH